MLVIIRAHEGCHVLLLLNLESLADPIELHGAGMIIGGGSPSHLHNHNVIADSGPWTQTVSLSSRERQAFLQATLSKIYRSERVLKVTSWRELGIHEPPSTSQQCYMNPASFRIPSNLAKPAACDGQQQLLGELYLANPGRPWAAPHARSRSRRWAIKGKSAS